MGNGGDLASKLEEIFDRRIGNGVDMGFENERQKIKDRIIVRTAIGTFESNAKNRFTVSELKSLLQHLAEI